MRASGGCTAGAIDARIAFHPETITIREILGEPNAALRRGELERMGYEVFLSRAQAQVLDRARARDRDPGGERRLLRIPLPEDEPLVCLCVVFPSTDRQYVLRVSTTTRSDRPGSQVTTTRTITGPWPKPRRAICQPHASRS